MIVCPSLGELVKLYRPARSTTRSKEFLVENAPTGREIIAMAHLRDGEMALNEPTERAIGAIYGTKTRVAGVDIGFHNHPRGDSHPSWTDANSARKSNVQHEVIGSVRGGIAQVQYHFGIRPKYVTIDAITSSQPIRRVAMTSDDEWRGRGIVYRAPIRLQGLPLPTGKERLDGVCDLVIVPPKHFLGKYRPEHYWDFFGKNAVDWATIFGQRTNRIYTFSQTPKPHLSPQPQT